MHRKLFIYDIETTYLKANTFSLGKQIVNHKCLDKAHNMYDIICISYGYTDSDKVHTLHWGYGPESSASMIAKFDKVIKKVQDENIPIIGKNNKRFDDKHLNTHRWLNGEPGMPEWGKYTDDLETQLRRYFYLPSYSLDYVSEIKGLGGKKRMEFSHWVNIQDYKHAQRLIALIGLKAVTKISELVFKRPLKEVLREGKKALKEMCIYNQKDVSDTKEIILDVSKHCEFKSNVIADYKGQLRCKDPSCGSTNIKKNGPRISNGIKYWQFYCNDHNGYAGKARRLNDGTWGKMV